MEIFFLKVGLTQCSGICNCPTKTHNFRGNSLMFEKHDLSTIERQKQMKLGFVEISSSVFFVI